MYNARAIELPSSMSERCFSSRTQNFNTFTCSRCFKEFHPAVHIPQLHLIENQSYRVINYTNYYWYLTCNSFTYQKIKEKHELHACLHQIWFQKNHFSTPLLHQGWPEVCNIHLHKLAVSSSSSPKISFSTPRQSFSVTSSIFWDIVPIFHDELFTPCHFISVESILLQI